MLVVQHLLLEFLVLPRGAMLFMVMGIIIGFVYRMKESRFITVFINGAADLPKCCAYRSCCAWYSSYHERWYDYSYNPSLGVEGTQRVYHLKNYIVLTYISICQCHSLSHQPLDSCQCNNGYHGTSWKNSSTFQQNLIITAYQSASGLLNLITPTSGIVMGDTCSWTY